MDVRDSQCQWKHWNNTEYIAGIVYASEESRSWKGACNLGSLMLPSFVKIRDYQPFVDWFLLKETIQTAVRMLDNVIDKNYYPHQDYENYQMNMRTIGLGVTGLADMLILLGMKYGSPEAVDFTEFLMTFISYWAYTASANLAQVKGSFPMYDKAILNSEYLQSQIKAMDGWKDSTNRKRQVHQWWPHWKGLLDKIECSGLRNARLLSVAPTGTMSLTFGNNCSSGLEPIYMLKQKRFIKFGGQDDEHKKDVALNNPVWDTWRANPDKYPWISEDLFVTALELPVEKHIAMLEAVAKHVDMSCSKTINIPEDYSFEDTKEVYMKCWKKDIKGCTIFRRNPIRQGIFVTDNDKEDKEEQKPLPDLVQNVLPRGAILQVDDNVIGRERHLTTGCGTLHFQAYFDPDTGELVETYASRGSQGGCNSYMVGLSRMVSLAARAGTPIDAIIDQLLSTPPCIAYNNRSRDKHDTSKGVCCAAAMGYALRDMAAEIQDYFISEENDRDESVATKDTETAVALLNEYEPHTEMNKVWGYYTDNNKCRYKYDASVCPECGDTLTFEGGCNVCKSCGWSKCG